MHGRSYQWRVMILAAAVICSSLGAVYAQGNLPPAMPVDPGYQVAANPAGAVHALPTSSPRGYLVANNNFDGDQAGLADRVAELEGAL